MGDVGDEVFNLAMKENEEYLGGGPGSAGL